MVDVAANIAQAASTALPPRLKIMAPAVADPDLIGYDKLYVLFLETAKPQIRKVIEAFADPSNYPIMVQCIHG